MKEVILVTSFGTYSHRGQISSEKTFPCIDYALNGEHIPVHIFIDPGMTSVEIRGIQEAVEDMHILRLNYYIQSDYAEVMAIKWAYNQGFERAYLIPDVVEVHEDFFEWHKASYGEEFACCADKYCSSQVSAPGNRFVHNFSKYGCSMSRDTMKLVTERTEGSYTGLLGCIMREQRIDRAFCTYPGTPKVTIWGG